MTKVFGVIIGVVLAVVLVSVVVIVMITKPVDANSDKAIPVGGMIKSDSHDYQQNQDKRLAKNPLIKIMQMSWSITCKSDQARIAKQTAPTVTQINDIAYIDDGNKYHLLDVYYPEGTSANDKLPIIIDIHGGGWMYGDKDLNKNYCLELASRGYVVFNISYRLVPDVTVDVQLQDVAFALKWISENMSNYPCSQDIMLTGDSAGGMLAGYSAVLLQSAQLREIFGVVDAGLELDALWLTSPVAYMNNGIGPMDIYSRLLWGSDYKQKPTYDYMNFDQIVDFAQLPPTYLLTSSGDVLARKQTQKIAKLLESKGVDCTLADYEKIDGKTQPHVFSVLDPFSNPGKTANDKAIEFYQNSLKELV